MRPGAGLQESQGLAERAQGPAQPAGELEGEPVGPFPLFCQSSRLWNGDSRSDGEPVLSIVLPSRSMDHGAGLKSSPGPTSSPTPPPTSSPVPQAEPRAAEGLGEGLPRARPFAEA